SFASGMAGVRNLSFVVYDLNACIEELAISAGERGPGRWVGRFFFVGGQVFLFRAPAPLGLLLGVRKAGGEGGGRGARGFVFVIPAPLALDELPLFANGFLQERFGVQNSTVLYFLPRPLASTSSYGLGLEAFALAQREIAESRLLIEATPDDFNAIQDHARR